MLQWKEITVDDGETEATLSVSRDGDREILSAVDCKTGADVKVSYQTELHLNNLVDERIACDPMFWERED